MLTPLPSMAPVIVTTPREPIDALKEHPSPVPVIVSLGSTTPSPLIMSSWPLTVPPENVKSSFATPPIDPLSDLHDPNHVPDCG
jgi:hypothetical protein